MGRVVVLEVNEVPPALLRWFADQDPSSAIAEVLRAGQLASTTVSDLGPQELYPSQTWASVATGVPYDKHGIYWYGDPKPAEYPLYWQVAARRRQVGIVGTLHSSPFDEQCTAPGLVFAVPDVFGSDSQTLPDSLRPMQAFNQSMTASNARAVASRSPARSYLSGLSAVPGSGLRPKTLTRLGLLASQVATGHRPKERLRTAQFVLLADVFERQLARRRPDLAVLFTNHVAAAMHRSWPASFPEDWEQPIRGPEWIAAYRDEIPFALSELDRVLARILRRCRAEGSTLVLISSMGQVGGGNVDQARDRTLVVSDPHAFAAALGMPDGLTLRAAMVPHLTYHFTDETAARVEAERLGSLTLAAGSLTIDRAGVSVTITYHLDDLDSGNGPDQRLVIDGTPHLLEDAGLDWVEVAEHKAGVHDAEGTLLVVNSPSVALPDQPVDYLDLAPALLIALGLDPLPHHRTPEITL